MHKNLDLMRGGALTYPCVRPCAQPCSEHMVCFSAGGEEGLLIGFVRQFVALGNFSFDRWSRRLVGKTDPQIPIC